MTQHATNAVDYNAGYYYRPVFRSENDFIKFKGIEVVSNQDLAYTVYQYDIVSTTRNIDMIIEVEMNEQDPENRSSFSRGLEQLKVPENERRFDAYVNETYNGIEYFAFHYPSDSTYIYWSQNDRVFCASLYGSFDQIDQILPLLQVERVTYNATPDHVTE